MTERWVTMVEKYVQNSTGFCRIIDPMDAVKLLARQHRAFVEMVKKVGQVTTSQFGTSNEAMAWRTACAEILAALAKQGASKKKD